MDRRPRTATHGYGSAGNNIQLSKRLSWLLRHGATQEGFELDDGGFLNVDDILKHRSFKMFTLDDIKKEVQSNEKQRYALRTSLITGKLQICANQGHSFTVENLDLTPIQKANDVAAVIHGTSKQNWESIQQNGLSRMNRNHIHFSSREPGAGAISGIRNTSEVLIYIDLQMALKDGIQFYISANDVILSPGNDKGIILPKYFHNVRHLK